MAGVDGGIMFPADRLRGWTQEVFQKVGVSRDDATLLTDSLIEANLRGVDTHLRPRRDRVRDEGRTPRARHSDPRTGEGFHRPRPGAGHFLSPGLT